jgi:pimeloyl-ACP methyl ester carboxylesterase
MDEDRIHRAVSDDGTEIAGRVLGQGPPLVLVHGAAADGESEWGAQLPRLTQRFTCYVMSTRGRGLSADHADHSPERLVEDIRAFVESIGEPVALAGISGGGMHVLGAAGRTDAVSAVAVYEPVVFEVADEAYLANFREAVVAVREAVTRCEPAEAARAFLRSIATDAEKELLTGADDLLEEAGRFAPVDLLEFQHHIAASAKLSPTDPSTLANISAPVLIMYGDQTPHAVFADGARYVADHVADALVRVIPDAGHLAATLGAEAVADEIERFLQATLAPA